MLLQKQQFRQYMVVIIFLISFKTVVISLTSQIFNDQQLIFNNTIFNKNIQTVLLHKTGFEMSEPIILLNSDEKLHLSFDEINISEIKNYKYTIQHCNTFWEASELLKSQYLEGFFEDYINNYEFSLNTTVHYIHYKLEFPNEYVRILKSGNYVIKVYEEDEDDLIFTRRFKVLNSKINVDAKIRPAEKFDERREKQEIGFTLFTNNLSVQNPEKEIIVIVQQNGRQDNMISVLKPVRNFGNELDYYFNQKTIFDGGNEFRNFDFKTLKYNSENIESIEYFEDIYHIYLKEDRLKAASVYSFEHDINGKRVIRNIDGKKDEIEADYCWVYFFLPCKLENIKGSVYVMGEFSDWLLKEENKLTYNFKRLRFEGKILLKQGYYNYQYVVKNDINNFVDLSLTEGNHAETTNEYALYVYFLEPGVYYHQLIGYQKISAPN